MGKWCLHASSFIFYQIVIKVAGNQDRHKSSDEFDFGPLVSMAYLYVFLKWDLTLAHWTQVSDRCPLGYLLVPPSPPTPHPDPHKLHRQTVTVQRSLYMHTVLDRVASNEDSTNSLTFHWIFPDQILFSLIKMVFFLLAADKWQILFSRRLKCANQKYTVLKALGHTFSIVINFQ